MDLITFAMSHLTEFYTPERLEKQSNRDGLEKFIDKAIEKLPDQKELFENVRKEKLSS